MNLQEKIVVITGGTKGLGKSLADFFNEKRAKVIVAASNNPSTENNNFIKTDVTNEQEIDSLVKKVVNEFSRIDIWINNAGIWVPHGPVEELDINRVREMNEVNIIGTIIGSKHALIQMRKQDSGTIINILSTSALEGRAGSSGYCASKYGATGFTNSLRKETEGSKIKIISVYPGGMKTHFFDEKKPDNYNSYMEPSYVAEKIIANIENEQPEEEIIIKRPTN
jgi:short-subunit dehydrogenase